MDAREQLVALSHKHNGKWERIMRAVQAREILTEEEAKSLFGDEDAVTILDNEYPNSFKYAHKPPFVIYCHGDKALLQDRDALTIVGSRTMKEHDLAFAKPFFEGMKKKRTLIVKATNWWFAETAMDCGHKVILVLGNGFDKSYPSAAEKTIKRIIDEGGLVISEYPNGTKPDPENFVILNRLIAALGKATLVISAEKHSATLIAVSFALEIGKDVYAVPNPMEAGNQCNNLVADGASLLAVDTDIE